MAMSIIKNNHKVLRIFFTASAAAATLLLLLLLSLSAAVDALSTTSTTKSTTTTSPTSSNNPNIFKTTYEFGNAQELTPAPLGVMPDNHSNNNNNNNRSVEEEKKKRQFEQFLHGQWRRKAPEKSLGDKMVSRKYVLDPYEGMGDHSSSSAMSFHKKLFNDEIENDEDDDEEEYRTFVGLSLGGPADRRQQRLDMERRQRRRRSSSSSASGGNDNDNDNSKERRKYKFYDMLGLDKHATQKDIRDSYRRLVKLYHPDANPEKDTSEAYNLLNRAYQVLTDPMLKDRYDLYGHKSLGTSAASDEEQKAKTRKNNNNKVFPKRIVASYTMAKSDMGDVRWKGSHGGPPFEVVAFGTKPLSERPLGSRRDERAYELEQAQAQTEAASSSNKKSPMMRDLYQLLSVSRTASLEEINIVYEIMLKRYDPEHHHDKDSYILYHHVQRAYEVLSDPYLRKRYDLYGLKGLKEAKSLPPSSSSSMEPQAVATTNIATSTTEADVATATATATATAVGPELYPQRYSSSQLQLPPTVKVGGASSHSLSRTTSIQQDRKPLATTTAQTEKFKAPPAEYRMTLAPIPVDRENERFNDLAKSDSIPLKAKTKASFFASNSARPNEETVEDFIETDDNEVLPFPILLQPENSLVQKEPPRSPPVQVGGAPVHNLSRSTSIQQDRKPLATTTAQTEKFKAPPAEYRMTLAPIPLDGENERFNDLAKSDSIPLKAKTKASFLASNSARPNEETVEDFIETDDNEVLPFPILLQPENSLVQKEPMASPLNERFNDLAKSDSIPLKATNKKAESATIEDLIDDTDDEDDDDKVRYPAMLFPDDGVIVKPNYSKQKEQQQQQPQKQQKAPPVRVGGAPVHNSSRRSTSIQKDRKPLVVATAQTAKIEFKAPPPEYRMTLAPIPLDGENERFNDLAKSDSIPIQAVAIVEAATTTKPKTTFEQPEDKAEEQEIASDHQEGNLVPFPILDTLPVKSKSPFAMKAPPVRVGGTPVHTTSSRSTSSIPNNRLGKAPSSPVVVLDQQDHIVATRPSNTGISLQKYDYRRKEFKAPSMQYRTTLEPIPLEDDECRERFQDSSLSEAF